MDPRLDDEARAVATMARTYGLIPDSISPFWEQIQPCCLGMESGGLKLHSRHHTDYRDQCRLQHFWDQLIKQLTYLALANSWGR